MAKGHCTGGRLYENEYCIQSGEDGITLLEGLDLVPPTRYKMDMCQSEEDDSKLRILDHDPPNEKSTDE